MALTFLPVPGGISVILMCQIIVLEANFYRVFVDFFVYIIRLKLLPNMNIVLRESGKQVKTVFICLFYVQDVLLKAVVYTNAV